jgi:hypothetical protein
MELGSEISEFFSSVATEGRAKMFGRKSLSLFAFLSSSSIGTVSIWILVISMVLNDEITGYYDGGDNGGHRCDGGVDGHRCVVVIIVAMMMMMVVMMVVGGDLMKMVVVVTMVMMGYGSDDGDDDGDGVW